MKIEINLDDKFFEEKFKRYRGASFSNSLDLLKSEATKIRAKKKGRYPAFVLDSKVLTYEFAKKIDIKTANIYQVDCPIEEIIFKPNTVIKPMYENSAKGVFIYDSNQIMYLNKNLTFLNETDAKEYALELVKSGMVQKDKWMVEELIQGEDIARDVKFYCFYGEIGLILESNRTPSLKRCWYDKDFSKVKTGKYNNNLFEGSGENLEELSKAAQRISLELPVPFIRLDFLQIGNDIYLGEFTPVPGGYAAFNQEWDKKLGEMYQHATVRISNDVAYGKIFDKYASLIKSEAEVIKIIKLLNS